ncbi:MAG: hypothetical protein V4482_04005 [Pseudomonadota bacterium]
MKIKSVFVGLVVFFSMNANVNASEMMDGFVSQIRGLFLRSAEYAIERDIEANFSHANEIKEEEKDKLLGKAVFNLDLIERKGKIIAVPRAVPELVEPEVESFYIQSF